MIDQEEAEEMSFVLSAISVPQKPLFRSDNQCSEKTLSFWQFASVEIKEGEESYTTNLCQQCNNKYMEATGDEPLTNWQRYEFVGKKVHRGRLWKMMGKEQYIREMWEHFLPSKSKSKKSFERRLKKKGEQEYRVSGSWNRQPESTCSQSNAAVTLIARTEL